MRWPGTRKEDREVVDHRGPDQWRFVVIPTSIFRVRETSIGLAVLEATFVYVDGFKLTNAIGYECFAGAVQETLDGL